MIGLVVILVVGGAMLFGGLALAATIVFRILFGLVLLPFRLIGFLLFLPLLILRGITGAVFGLAMVPVALVGIPLLVVGGILAVVLFSLLTPILPLLAIVAVIWLLAKTATHPRVI